MKERYKKLETLFLNNTKLKNLKKDIHQVSIYNNTRLCEITCVLYLLNDAIFSSPTRQSNYNRYFKRSVRDEAYNLICDMLISSQAADNMYEDFNTSFVNVFGWLPVLRGDIK